MLTGALGSALIAGLLIFLTRGAPAPAAEVAASAPFAGGAAAGGGPPPDISNMSPRERFDRLYNRIMTAAESGDEATVTKFSPMALSAYGMLDTVDADARYHAALIRLHTGDIDGATALGDTILANNPGHLFGYIVLGTVARFRKDDAGLSKAYSGFLNHYRRRDEGRPRGVLRPRAVDHRLQESRGSSEVTRMTLLGQFASGSRS